MPHFEGDHLILYRLGQPDTIPYDQLPLARQVGDFLATPLVGYPVQYCNPEETSDDSGNVMRGLYIPKCEGLSAGSAKYVRMQTSDKKLFQYKSKPDILPANFFDGNWSYF